MPHRGAHPEFSTERLKRALLVTDSSSAEIFVGGWLVILRGIMLVSLGYAYGEVARLLMAWSFTPDRVGFLLVAVGLAQILGTGTEHYRVRAAIAFLGSLVCLVVWIAYVGVDLEHSALGWTWGALMVSEAVLSWRILLARLAALNDAVA